MPNVDVESAGSINSRNRNKYQLESLNKVIRKETNIKRYIDHQMSRPRNIGVSTVNLSHFHQLEDASSIEMDEPSHELERSQKIQKKARNQILKHQKRISKLISYQQPKFLSKLSPRQSMLQIPGTKLSQEKLEPKASISHIEISAMDAQRHSLIHAIKTQRRQPSETTALSPSPGFAEFSHSPLASELGVLNETLYKQNGKTFKSKATEPVMQDSKIQLSKQNFKQLIGKGSTDLSQINSAS